LTLNGKPGNPGGNNPGGGNDGNGTNNNSSSNSNSSSNGAGSPSGISVGEDGVATIKPGVKVVNGHAVGTISSATLNQALKQAT
ncbi:hypothetical protein, partial [Peribacillus sp. NPDC056705]|uniref:hypothetical protein n=1 Tax=Peribacillus sp. NPDC056705 TaxID=3345918 RepID=UPI0037484994